MNHRPSVPASNSRIINGTALGFSILFLLASLAAACFVGEWGHVFLDWRRIMISPCPLVTDYLAIGGLSSSFLNAGACGLACFFFMVLLKGDSHANTLAGYFLVVAHCFYGLNFFKHVAVLSGSLSLYEAEGAGFQGEPPHLYVRHLLCPLYQ